VEVTKEGGTKETLKTKNIILATGARARILPSLPVDSRIWYAREAMTPPFMPKKLLVIGSGAIGIEFASFYRLLGCEVTVIEMQDRILPNEDAEISALARKNFEKQGITIHTQAQFKSLTPNKTNLEALVGTTSGEIKIEADALIVAIGIVGNTENLGLEKTKVKIERNQIETNEWCETGEKGIFAIGDVAGAPWLAHKASHEGVLCAEIIAGKSHLKPLNKGSIPGCTYSLPQIASLGLTEEQAKAKGFTLKVGRFPYLANGKALAMGEPEGLVKTIFDAKTGEFLGAHMIGAEVTELIHSFCLAKTLEATEAEFMHTIFPHPTLSEMIHESVLDAYGQVIHY
jgi:dihydrolipoamide dehydrogenase